MGKLLPVSIAMITLTFLMLYTYTITLLLILCMFILFSLYYLLKNDRGRFRRYIIMVLTLSLPVLLLNSLLVTRGATEILGFRIDIPIYSKIVVISWRFTLEAVYYSVVMALKLAGVVLVFSVGFIVLTPEEIFGSLPSRTTLLIATSARFLPVLEEDARKSLESQRARGLFTPTGKLDMIKQSRYVFFPLMARAVSRSIEAGQAYTIKGLLSGNIRPYKTSRVATALALLSALIAVCIAYLSLGQASAYPVIHGEAVVASLRANILIILSSLCALTAIHWGDAN